MNDKRKIITGERWSYRGLTQVEMHLDYIHNGEWIPILPKYIIRKLQKAKGKNVWSVYRVEYCKDIEALNAFDEFWEADNLTLVEAKKYVREKLESLS